MKNILEIINQQAKECPEEFIKISENEYKNELDELSDLISGNKNIKIVSLAGPSGSGKTTTAHILCENLKSKGRNTTVLSLDDFYLPTEQLPVLPDGRKDIESVNSLDLALLRKCFKEIIQIGKTLLPRYDFKTKTRFLDDNPIDISQNNGIVIVEGLHALNPHITELVPAENIYKIYISVNCPIKMENGDFLLSSRQIRLIRRTLRDRIFRNTDINTTLSLWNGVVEGERKYLYCFKETADFQLITLHPYEVCIYKRFFLELEECVKKDSPCYDYFMGTVNALKKFNSMDIQLVPENSLIREFIGNGHYK